LVTRALAIVCALAGAAHAAAAAASSSSGEWSDWDALLKKYDDDQGRVDYAGLRAHDAKKFDGVIAAIAASSPKSAPDRYPTAAARLAYYLNAYNALVWKNVLDHPALARVDADPAFFAKTEFTVGGSKTTLNALESQLRAEFKEPRVHVALNCASASCPRLPREAFTAEKLEAQLTREARRFVAEPRNVAFDPAAKTVKLSKIFDWYKSDFGDVIAWINRYRDDKLPPGAKLVFNDYDWTSNARR
jgi:Protein of unknown function, DUF547